MHSFTENKIFQLICFARNKEILEIYISMALRSFAGSMISLFIPIFLFKQTNSILPVIYFYIIYSLIFAVFSPLSAKLASRYGYKHGILISTPFLIIFYFMLYSIEKGLPYMYPAVLLGLSSSIFWISLHANFAKSTDKKYRGDQLGKVNFFSIVGALTGPVVGGLILSLPLPEHTSFNILFISSSIILLFSSIPLFLSEERYISSKSKLNFRFIKNHYKDSLALMGYGASEIIVASIWPIFLFIILEEYFTLGALSSSASVFTALSSLYIGKLTLKHDNNNLLKIGTIIFAVSLFIRSFFDSFPYITFVFFATVLGGLGLYMLDIPFSTITYGKANRTNVYGYLVFREVFLCVGRIFILLLLALIMFKFSLDTLTTIKTGLVIGSFLGLFAMSISEKKPKSL